MSADELLRVDGLSKVFGGVRAVDDVSFSLGAGEVLGLVGANGAGKTTCFNLVGGFLRPSHGSVHLGGADVTQSRPDARAARGMARTFQGAKLFDDLSAAHNLELAMHVQLKRGPLSVLGLRANPRGSTRSQAEGLFDLVRLDRKLLGARVGEMSYGDRRRLGVAMALANDPTVLLLDEPAAGLNNVETSELGHLMRQVAARGTGVLVVEHDMGLVMEFCDRIIVLDAGRCIASGTPEQIRTDEAVIGAYLGRRAKEGQHNDVGA